MNSGNIYELIDTNENAFSGLYGKVYCCREMPLDRKVAVKVIKPEWPNHADIIEHAKKIVRAGNHPNLVTVYQVAKVTISGEVECERRCHAFQTFDDIGQIKGVRLL